jgi:asparagine synthetase B (glutamine-hydrolysing)
VIRACLRAAIAEMLPPGTAKIALALSGGTDSLCLLFALREFELPIHAYTYTVEGYESDDLKRARRVTDHFKLPLTVARIPVDLDRIVTDLRNLMAWGVTGKVRLQCMHGHMWLAPMVQEPVIFNGSGVDGLYGSYKQFAFDGSHKDKAKFDARRQKHLNNPNDDAMLDQTQCYRRYGVKVVYPYRYPSVVSYLMSKDYATLMKPRYKADTVKDFAAEYALFPHLYNPRGSQQIQAGTRGLHDTVLLPSRFNRGHKRVDEVYKDLEAGLV